MSGRYWLLTLPEDAWNPPNELPDQLAYLRGQLECGDTTGYRHWQVLAGFKRTTRLAGVKRLFGGRCHAELGRSNAAREYVWKEDTRVAGTQFELGSFAIRRNNSTDWAAVKRAAIAGAWSDIPDDILLRHANSLVRVHSLLARPTTRTTSASVFWGTSGAGKSYRARSEAGDDAYFKVPSTKWWDGYQGQINVVIDEFSGQISLCHILRWLDNYPCYVEIKGGATPLKAERFWITSNVSPNDWYPDATEEQRRALRRRIQITHFTTIFQLSNE